MTFAQSSEVDMHKPVPSAMQAGDSSWIAALTELSSNQIGAGMEEAGVALAELSNSLLRAAQSANALRVNGDVEAASHEISELSQSVMNAFASLQFIDRLQQRLGNVAGNLSQLSAELQCPRDPIDWGGLATQMRERYTMEAERQMFDAAVKPLTSPDIEYSGDQQ